MRLCSRCDALGARNGRTLAQMAEKQKYHVHQIHAQHSRKSGRPLPSSVFGGLRNATDLVRRCRAGLNKNIVYLCGLANGTRGTFVGAVHDPVGVCNMNEALLAEVA